MPDINPQDFTILVVDDSPTNIKVVTKYLSYIGFKTATATNGNECLEYVRQNPLDLILLDIMMPGIDGFEVCKQLKSNPPTEHIPIIFMTALAETQDKVKGFEMGAVDYITKPIDHEEVLSRVTTHLRMYALTHKLEALVAERTQALEEALRREQHLALELQHSLEKETEMSQLKSQIIEVISHEFRTPLTVISQSAALLQQYLDKLSAEQKEDKFFKIKESVFFIDRLLREVSQVNAINAQDLHIEFTYGKWDVFCKSLKHALLHAQADNARLICHSTPADATFRLDVHATTQVLQQLVSNALKFSDASQPIHFTAELSEAGAHFVIEDQGIGIPEEEQSKIFDLFYRASNVDARRGLGIGLHIANQLTRAMGGTLHVSSAGTGQGTRMSLCLPQTPATVPEAT